MRRLKDIVAAVTSDVRREANVPYGPHARQIMDIYSRPGTIEAPVLVFLHGGGFQTGEPASNGYQGKAALDHGAVFVAMGYRLRPETRFPDSVEDVELGLQWLEHNIAERGGAPNNIYLSGHSAGAMLAAWACFRDSSLPRDLIKGAVLISGFYDLMRVPSEMLNPESKRYVPHLANAIERVPEHILLVVGEHDYERALPDAEALKAQLPQAELYIEPGTDHYSANRGFYSADGLPFRRLRGWMGLE
jgi:acetyl esterase/lipase